MKRTAGGTMSGEVWDICAVVACTARTEAGESEKAACWLSSFSQLEVEQSGECVVGSFFVQFDLSRIVMRAGSAAQAVCCLCSPSHMEEEPSEGLGLPNLARLAHLACADRQYGQVQILPGISWRLPCL